MIGLIFAVLALALVQLLLAPTLYYLVGSGSTDEKVKVALGPRDQSVALPLLGQRAERAFRNLQESLPFFLTLALLSLYLERADGLTALGAMVFVVARAAYVPAYLVGPPGVRSACWTVGIVGLVLMAIGVAG